MPETVVPAPAMDGDGLKCFQESAGRSRCFLEFGCGGSTVYAATIARVPNIICVDSDKVWCEKVKTSVNISDCRLYLEHCDLGEVGEWGTPKSRDKVGNFWKYMTTPWHIAKKNNLVPDTVLIGGRFRIASFLYSLVAARIGTVILFDDYLDRPQYFVCEGYCRLMEKRGRMGVFIADRGFSVLGKV